MTRLIYVYDDGGRAAAGSKAKGDCAARALAIVAEISYAEACRLIDAAATRERGRMRDRRGKRVALKSSSADGVWRETLGRVMAGLGWRWIPTMSIGSGCSVHLRHGELPTRGRLLVRVSGHFTAVVDGVLRDMVDCSRRGTRCVYGYWSRP